MARAFSRSLRRQRGMKTNIHAPTTIGASAHAAGPLCHGEGREPDARPMTAATMTLIRSSRISRMIPQYCSDGIWFVFHRREQSGHVHVSP